MVWKLLDKLSKPLSLEELRRKKKELEEKERQILKEIEKEVKRLEKRVKRLNVKVESRCIDFVDGEVEFHCLKDRMPITLKVHSKRLRKLMKEYGEINLKGVEEIEQNLKALETLIEHYLTKLLGREVRVEVDLDVLLIEVNVGSFLTEEELEWLRREVEEQIGKRVERMSVNRHLS